MTIPKKLLALGAAAITTLSIAACSKDEAPQAEQSFEVQSSSAEASTPESTSSEAETPTTSAKNEKEAEPTLIDPAKSLELSNGKFRLTKDEAGPGSPEEIVTSYPEMPEYGFSELQVTVPRAERNGIMQYKKGSKLELKIAAADLSKVPFEEREWAELKFKLLDESGSDVLKGQNVRPEWLPGYQNVNYDEIKFENKDIKLSDYSEANVAYNLEKEGKFTLEIEVAIPGYKPFNISQPVIVA